ncbi:MAG: hypothetical protein IJX35_00385 [Candidatus Methanomethylophilaceae archaeon]|nr:hypothetical protein [Candidatus Methanomethylophilaceae archaeon]
MRYKVSVPGYIDVATCGTVGELIKDLRDGGCMHSVTTSDLADMMDALLSEGVWTHRFADDPRFEFVVEVVE